MTAILSTTFSDTYLFYLPITTWAWNKLGVRVVCFMPEDRSRIRDKRLLIGETNRYLDNNLAIITFTAPDNKLATYAQCARLYAAATPLFEDNEILITSDIDMAVFGKDLLAAINPELITIVGADLVPDGQFPMCYIAMTAEKWRRAMNIPLGKSHQDMLDDLLGGIECENFRGNYWAKDQEEVYNKITASGQMMYKATRAAKNTQFATRRADRDGWPTIVHQDIIDAHLPRPGYTAENFAKILDLFMTMYPNENFSWMQEYRDEYVKLI